MAAILKKNARRSIPTDTGSFGRALVAYRSGNIPSAIALCREALATAHENFDLLNLLGTALLQLKDHTAAAINLEQAVAVCPDRAPSWSNLGAGWSGERTNHLFLSEMVEYLASRRFRFLNKGSRNGANDVVGNADDGALFLDVLDCSGFDASAHDYFGA